MMTTTTYLRVFGDGPGLEVLSLAELRHMARNAPPAMQELAADELARRGRDEMYRRCEAIARECMGLHNPPKDLLVALAVAYRAGSSSNR